jgi:hypothetical protein
MKTNTTPKFVVHLGGRRYKRFETLALASVFCDKYYRRTKIVLSIVAQDYPAKGPEGQQ